MGLFRSSEIVGIAESALEFARASATETHPNEYMAQLRGEEASNLGLDMSGTVLSEVIVVPGTETNPVSAKFNPMYTPNDMSSAGSIHSHPNGVLRPSDADLATFDRNDVHIILGAPYGPDDWKAFDNDGDTVDLPVVEIEPPEEDFFHFTQEDLDEQLEDDN